MKLLYYIPAYGIPNLNIKFEILEHNIKYISNQINKSIDLCINFYSPSQEIKEILEKNENIDNLFVYEKKGVLTELFLTNPNNSIIKEYDYILFILDDVKIININIIKMIEIKEKNKLEILSPKILKSTHSFMNKFSKGVSINNFLEVYFLLLNPDNFYKFLSLHTIENKWMWGVDFLFGYYNIKVGVFFKFIAEHMIPSNSNTTDAKKLYIQYLKKYTNFKCLKDIKKKFKPIKTIYKNIA